MRLALAALAILLTTCTYSNLCPKVCLEEGCCDPTCRTPGDDLTSCDPQRDCTYMGVNYTITCDSTDSRWHCQGGFDFCCPIHQPTVGAECSPGLQCLYSHGVECECDSAKWNCAGLALDGGTGDGAPVDGGTGDGAPVDGGTD